MFLDLAPIVLFVYNRPWHTEQTINALLKNKEAKHSNIYIYADGLKSNVSKEQEDNFYKTREYIHTISGFKNVTIFESEQNKGLGKSIIGGVTSILEKHESIIVLEDDIVVSQYFLRFMNESLKRYKEVGKVICINAYNINIDSQIKETTYFLRGGDCQGWATWSRAWKQFNPNAKELHDYMIAHKRVQKDYTFNGTMYYMELLRAVVEGRNDSWAIRWYTSTFINGGLCLYPTKSLTQNIGFGEGATNTTSNDGNDVYTRVEATDEFIEYKPIPIKENKVARKEYESIYKSLNYYPRAQFIKKLKRIIKNILKK